MGHRHLPRCRSCHRIRTITHTTIPRPTTAVVHSQAPPWPAPSPLHEAHSFSIYIPCLAPPTTLYPSNSNNNKHAIPLLLTPHTVSPPVPCLYHVLQISAPFYGPCGVTASWASGILRSNEIESRGTVWSMISGAFVAIPSGTSHHLPPSSRPVRIPIDMPMHAARQYHLESYRHDVCSPALGP